MREVGDAKREVSERVLDLPEDSFGVLNAIPQLLHRRHGFFGRFLGSAQSSHFFRALIEFVPELLHSCRHDSPLFAQFLDISPRDVVPASSESRTDVIEVFAEVFEIVHESHLAKADGI
jgi:hypothetical protein